jgi:hypothetical protein
MSMDLEPMGQPSLCLIHNYWTKTSRHFVVHSEFGYTPKNLLVSSVSRMLDSSNRGS